MRVRIIIFFGKKFSVNETALFSIPPCLMGLLFFVYFYRTGQQMFFWCRVAAAFSSYSVCLIFLEKVAASMPATHPSPTALAI